MFVSVSDGLIRIADQTPGRRWSLTKFCAEHRAGAIDCGQDSSNCGCACQRRELIGSIRFAASHQTLRRQH
ncbi:MAG TPA: hypothetical protein VIY30_15910, partial [Burkholderiaceae bacterium]